MTPLRRRLVAVAVLAALLGGIVAVFTGGSDPRSTAALPEGGSGFPPAQTSGRVAPQEAPPPDPGERLPGKGSAKLPLALERAAAQLFVVGFAGTDPTSPFFERLRRRDWGAVLLERANYVDRTQFTALTGEIGVVAREVKHAPPLVIAAQLGGSETAVPDVGPRRQALAKNGLSAARQASAAARKLRPLGVDAVLSPSADVGLTGGPWDGRAFSDDPATVTRLAGGAVGGWKTARVAPIVGHFPGEGAASGDPNEGTATVGLGLDELRDRDLRPFRSLAARLPAVQMSSALYAGLDGVTPATLDPDAVALLRDQGFKGAVVSANLTAATLSTGGSVGAAAVAALRAGCDLLLVPGNSTDQEEAYRAVVRAVQRGQIGTARVRDALVASARLRRLYGAR